jgi:hypothetical protein
MSTAVLTPVANGCVFELNGMVHHFDSYELAEREAVKRGLPFTKVERFAPTPLVVAESPALRNP